MPEPVAKETPSTAEAIGMLRRWIERRAVAAGATALQRADIALAVSEALTNIVQHAYVDRGGEGPMRIRTGQNHHRLYVEVEDEGIGMRKRADKPGVGLALIASLAAEHDVGRGRTGAGTLVRMAFALGEGGPTHIPRGGGVEWGHAPA